MKKQEKTTKNECNKIGHYYADESMITEGLIYMDHQASTPIDPRVMEVLIKVAQEDFGNPHSISHPYGWRAKAIVNTARGQVANVIGAKPKEVIFTSGATESNNLAIKGAVEFYGSTGKNHIITTSIEHKCVLQVCKYLETKGCQVTYVEPQQNGTINPADIKKAITSKTLLASIFGVHNEIGVINKLEEIGQITRAMGVLFHTDIAQAFGKIPIDVNKMNIDLASISGHKIYGPKGIGALYVRSVPKVRLSPLLHGGGQERGLRSGTVPTMLVAALGEAAKIAQEDQEKDAKRIAKLGKQLKEGIMSIPDVRLNGDPDQRYQGNWNFSFAFIEGESMMMAINKVAVSSSSACASITLEPSYVLKALKVTEELAHSSIRFGIGRHTTEEEVDEVVKMVRQAVEKLRAMSPLWEMHQQGVDLSKVKWQHK